MMTSSIETSLKHFQELSDTRKGEVIMHIMRNAPVMLEYCQEYYPAIFELIKESACRNGSVFLNAPFIQLGESEAYAMLELMIQKRGHIPYDVWDIVIETYPHSHKLQSLYVNYAATLEADERKDVNKRRLLYLQNHIADMDYDTLCWFREHVHILSPNAYCDAIHNILNVSKMNGWDMSIVLKKYIPYHKIDPSIRTQVSLHTHVESVVMDKEWLPEPPSAHREWVAYVTNMIESGRYQQATLELWTCHYYWNTMPLDVKIVLLGAYSAGRMSDIFFEWGHNIIDEIKHPKLLALKDLIIDSDNTTTWIYNIFKRLWDDVYVQNIELLGLENPYTNVGSDWTPSSLEKAFEFMAHLVGDSNLHDEITLHI